MLQKMNANREHERRRCGVVSQVAMLQAWGASPDFCICGQSYSQKPGHLSHQGATETGGSLGLIHQSSLTGEL